MIGGLLIPHIERLQARGVSVRAMVKPTLMGFERGHRGADGWLDADSEGDVWFGFDELRDIAFWDPRTGQTATGEGRVYAFDEESIRNPWFYMFDDHLPIFADPLAWLRAERKGIVVIDWTIAFDRLRDTHKVGIEENLLPLWRRCMRPQRMPEVFVLTGRKAIA